MQTQARRRTHTSTRRTNTSTKTYTHKHKEVHTQARTRTHTSTRRTHTNMKTYTHKHKDVHTQARKRTHTSTRRTQTHASTPQTGFCPHIDGQGHLNKRGRGKHSSQYAAHNTHKKHGALWPNTCTTQKAHTPLRKEQSQNSTESAHRRPSRHYDSPWHRQVKHELS
jgi:hypothetical protein